MPVADFSIHAVNPAVQGQAPAAAKAADKTAPDDGSFSFGTILNDILDVVNPLQHLPVISTLYRHLTGDKIDVPEKLAGDLLYGGPLGLAFSVGDTIFEKLTGKSVGDTAYAMVVGDDTPQVAAADTPADVKPASSLNLPMPDFSLLTSFDSITPPSDMAAPEIAQRATAAYRARGALVPSY
jgi:hypothetical protein